MFKNKRCLLCIHGFGRMRSRDFTAIKEHANKEAWDVDVITFDLYEPFAPNPRYEAWLQRAEDVLRMQLALYEEVNLLGFSMGGVIATYLASKYPGVARLVLVSPAFRFGNLSTLQYFPHNTKEHLRIEQKPMVQYYLDRRMIASYIKELTRVVHDLKDAQEHCYQDVLIFATNSDEIIPYGASIAAMHKLKGKRRKLITCVDAHHELLLHPQFYEEIGKEIDFFLHLSYNSR
ncbi:MAG: alpha/beta hydrolase [Erysipelotrichaceae bacterium]